jgi:hypothetical protein
MPIWKPEKLQITPEEVIRGQGADPEKIRTRRPQLFEVAARAIELGLSYLEPQVLYAEFEINGLRHESIQLSGGTSLSGPLVADHLASAQKTLILVATVGPAVEEFAAQTMVQDPVLGLALDGVGSAGVEKLANSACTMFEAQAAEQGLQVTVPLSPGMIGWEVRQGQSQIFSALPANAIDVRLTESALMIPKKSLSLVLGFGTELDISGVPCDFCTMRETCNYRTHYEAIRG